ncbi:hypothetical protein [Burkholderia stagnalis]|uniref:hypothetical protein n=1 Tax=Burkholderia stagnalis TaxID=1503054 RepID=UPI000AFF7D27|nr:hypothetical protein [Burkholderia stagnalis]
MTPQDVDNWKIAVLRPDLALAKKNGQSCSAAAAPVVTTTSTSPQFGSLDRRA